MPPWAEVRAFSPIVPQFPHSVLLVVNELAYLKCLARDLEKSRRSVNVRFCDCCSLKTGSVSLEEIFYDCLWVPESPLPYGTIPVCKHVCMCRYMLMTVAECTSDCDHDSCNCLYSKKPWPGPECIRWYSVCILVCGRSPGALLLTPCSPPARVAATFELYSHPHPILK